MTKSENTPFNKRVKRRITAREHTFYVSTPFDNTRTTQKELTTLFGTNIPVTDVDGGLEFNGRIDDCCKANLHLRTAGRILMRIQNFKAENFRTLEKKLRQIDWELYFPREAYPDIQVSLHKSRLYHSGAVEEIVHESIKNAIETAWDTPLNPESPPQTIFVRSFNDSFTVSIDSSGAHLHKRGFKQAHGKAPLRETLAAMILLTAGYDGSKPLIDPMCGTGTFALEAAMIAGNIPPGMYRHFAFEKWPCLSINAWNHILKLSLDGVTITSAAPIFASDTDKVACKTVEASLKELTLPAIQVDCHNFFTVDPAQLTPDTGLVVINPPFGIRLASRNKSRKLIDSVFHHLAQRYKGWDAAVISPWKNTPPGLTKRHTIRPIKHGGLDLFVHYCSF